ncbi:E3 ubiquitin ligase [Friedmanniomyces endolithicus]|nr:E3 ubiquitin ligase [Friedmanniomyces endolithicus]KAK0833717.1 E3 ubiquitin ligase [Friedmanniomyces endolithicus]
MASTSSDLPQYRNHGHSRKRLKISRNGAAISPAPANTDIGSTAAIMSLTTNNTNGESSSAAQTHAHDSACHHETALKSLHTDVDAIRQLCQCQICQNFMFEPYSLACGHTYCYSCLNQWIGEKAVKTCPDCRAVITQQPTPSYVIRELVLIFVSRTQLLPDGETAEEYDDMAKSEAALVAKDKANTDPRTGGLFKGRFNLAKVRRGALLYDPGDAVERCPFCHWEWEGEDGVCLHCGDSIEDFSDDSDDLHGELDHDFFVGGVPPPGDGAGHVDMETDDDEELWGENGPLAETDDEFDPELYEAAFGEPPPVRPNIAHSHRHHWVVDVTSDRSDEEGSDSEEHDSDLDGFIVDDAREADMAESSDTEVQEVPPTRTRHTVGGHVIISDDEDDDGHSRTSAISVDDSDDEAPVLGTIGRTKRNRAVPRQRPFTISSDEESSEDESTTEQQPELANGGFSPIQEGSDDQQSAPSLRYDHSDAASEASSAPPHFHDAEEGSHSSDDGASEDASETASTAEPPPPMHNNNRRPHPMEHSERSNHATPSLISHRTHTASVPTRPQISTHTRHPSARNPPLTRARRMAPARSHPAHPFQLANTLRDVNARTQHSRPDLSLGIDRQRSESAFSGRSTRNGVQRTTQHSTTTEAGSGSDSSRTVGHDGELVPRGNQQLRSTVVGYATAHRVARSRVRVTRQHV